MHVASGNAILNFFYCGINKLNFTHELGTKSNGRNERSHESER